MSLCSKSALNLPLHSLRVYSPIGSMEFAKRTNAGNQSRELLASKTMNFLKAADFLLLLPY
jgi:hypothetical protein